MKVIEDRYIGDGVYASFDGYHIFLDTRAQEPVHRIGLEPAVLEELERYKTDVQAACKQAESEQDSTETKEG